LTANEDGQPRRTSLWVSVAAGVAVVALLVVGYLAYAALACCDRAGPASSVAPSPVVGVIVDIDSAGLADVRGFSLRTSDQTVITFRLGVLENAIEFPPGHLAEHQATAEPIRVFFRAETDGLVVYRIEDASP
jgi:hypothetical protein